MSKHQHQQKRDITGKAELEHLMEAKKAASEHKADLLDNIHFLQADAETPIADEDTIVNPGLRAPEAKRPEFTRKAAIGNEPENERVDQTISTLANPYFQLLDMQLQFLTTAMDSWNQFMMQSLKASPLMTMMREPRE